MGKLFRMSLLVTAVALAAPSAVRAQAQFDGTYAGVSATMIGTMSGGRGAGCAPSFVPAPLTVSGGRARTTWSQKPMEGTVSPQGQIVMHSEAAGRVEGQIDAQGNVQAGYSGYCQYKLVWRKR